MSNNSRNWPNNKTIMKITTRNSRKRSNFVVWKWNGRPRHTNKKSPYLVHRPTCDETVKMNGMVLYETVVTSGPPTRTKIINMVLTWIWTFITKQQNTVPYGVRHVGISRSLAPKVILQDRLFRTCHMVFVAWEYWSLTKFNVFLWLVIGF